MHQAKDMFSSKKVGLVAILCLPACSVLNPEFGFLPLMREDKASIDSWIIDGKTTRDQMNAKLGYYHDDYTPKMADLIRCKATDRSCAYTAYSNHHLWSLSASFDKDGVVTRHAFSEKPADF